MPMFVLFLTLLQVCTGQAVGQDLHLSYETVSSLAGLPLHCYNTEFPNKLNQVLSDDSELLSPSGEPMSSVHSPKSLREGGGCHVGGKREFL